MKVKVIIIAALCLLLVAGQGIMAQVTAPPPPPPPSGGTAGGGTSAFQPPAGAVQSPGKSTGTSTQSSAPSSSSKESAATRQTAAEAQAQAAAQASGQSQTAAGSSNAQKNSLGLSVDGGRGVLVGLRYERAMGSHMALSLSGEALIGGYDSDDKPRGDYGDDVYDFNSTYFGGALGVKYYTTSPLKGFYIGAGLLAGYSSWDWEVRRFLGSVKYIYGGLAFGAYTEAGYRLRLGRFYLQPEVRIHYHTGDLENHYEGTLPDDKGTYLFLGGGIGLGWSF